MKANKFWKWKNQTETEERTLFLDGVISEVSWFDDDITPQMFKEELLSGSGKSRCKMRLYCTRDNSAI